MAHHPPRRLLRGLVACLVAAAAVVAGLSVAPTKADAVPPYSTYGIYTNPEGHHGKWLLAGSDLTKVGGDEWPADSGVQRVDLYSSKDFVSRARFNYLDATGLPSTSLGIKDVSAECAADGDKCRAQVLRAARTVAARIEAAMAPVTNACPDRHGRALLGTYTNVLRIASVGGVWGITYAGGLYARHHLNLTYEQASQGFSKLATAAAALHFLVAVLIPYMERHPGRVGNAVDARATALWSAFVQFFGVAQAIIERTASRVSEEIHEGRYGATCANFWRVIHNPDNAAAELPV